MRLLRSAIRMAMRRGWSKGVVDGSPVWAVVGGVALIAYLADRVMRREVDVVFSEKLAPGQSIRITHVAEP